MQYFQVLNPIDRFSIICSVFFMALLTCYLLFGLFFIGFKANDLALVKRSNVQERLLERTETLHAVLNER